MSATHAFKQYLLRVSSSSCVHFVTDGGEQADTLWRQMRGKGKVADVTTVIQELQDAGLFVATFDASLGVDVETMVGAVNEAMAFPAFSGMNWDALDERLSDLEWLPAAGYILFWLRSRALWCDSPHEAGLLTEIWMNRALDWERKQTPFHLVFV